MFNEEDHPRGEGDEGGQFVKKDEGQSKSTPKPPARPKSKPQPKPEPKAETKPKPAAKTEPKPEPRRGPMKRGGDNDPAQVKELQSLLKALGLSNHSANGAFDEATENAVKQAQKRLGLKPTGRASAALVRKMMAAHALSPCIKRSGDLDCSDVVRAEFPNLSAALDSGQLDEEDSVTELLEAEPAAELMRYERAWALDDIAIRSGGDGRTIDAYAAVFDTPSEIRDQHGHYMEVISRTAFNRAISHGIDRVQVYYHHGMTLHGTPSDLGSVPIGSPVDIRADGKGLRTISRLNKSALADSVLEAIRNGDIRGYSFRGRIFQSNPTKVPRSRSGTIPTITRTELGLTEYGPTPNPAYAEAGILAIRSVDAVAASIAALDPEERAELIRMLSVATPLDPETEPATPIPGLGAEDSPAGRSGRFQMLQEELRALGVL